MTQRQYSKYQQDIIGRYYENLDVIMLQKLQELVTELFLAMNTPKEDKLWLRAQKAMAGLKIPNSVIDHIMRKRDVQVLARNVEDWLKKSARK